MKNLKKTDFDKFLITFTLKSINAFNHFENTIMNKYTINEYKLERKRFFFIEHDQVILLQSKRTTCSIQLIQLETLPNQTAELQTHLA